MPLVEFIPAVTKRFKAPRHMMPLMNLFERAANGESIRAVINTCPRIGKTEGIIHAIVRSLARNPARQIAYVTYGTGLSYAKSRAARKLAKEIGVPMDRASHSVSDWRTGVDDGGLSASGILGPLTGKGFHDIYADDLLRGRADAESAVIRNRTWDEFNASAFTRIEPGGSCFVIATRWHVDDPSGRLIKMGWEHVNLPAINEDGESIWPERWPIEDLLKIKKQIGEYDWSSLYMGDPRVKGDSVFSDVHYATRIPEGCRYAIGIDLAYTERKTADYCVAVVLAEKDGFYCVEDVVRFQGRVESFAAHLSVLQNRYPRAPIQGYVSTIERQVLQLLSKQYGVRITPLLTKGEDKFVRAQPVAAAWNAGKIHVLASRDEDGHLVHKLWTNDFVDELVSFTGVNDPHDDQVDALASAFAAFTMPKPQTVADGRAAVSALFGKTTRRC